jgi:hypothetical protein
VAHLAWFLARRFHYSCSTRRARFPGHASPPETHIEVDMAKTDKDLAARLTVAEVEIEIIKTGLGDLAAELAAAAATPVPVPAVDMAATNRVLSEILARLDQPLVMKKGFQV